MGKSKNYDNDTDAMNEYIKMIEVMDDFAYPIIMGYASEEGSFQSVARQYYTYGNFIMPEAFHNYKNIGANAKLLYRLWRIRYEIIIIDNTLKNNDENWYNIFRERIDHLLCYEGTKEDISESSLKKYRNKLDIKLKEMQKEIEVFRNNNLK